EVLATKAADAAAASGTGRLVIAGGVSANRRLRERLAARAARDGFELSFPPLALCTDHGAMIALAGALRLAAGEGALPAGFEVRHRWPLESLAAPLPRCRRRPAGPPDSGGRLRLPLVRGGRGRARNCRRPGSWP